MKDEIWSALTSAFDEEADGFRVLQRGDVVVGARGQCQRTDPVLTLAARAEGFTTCCKDPYGGACLGQAFDELRHRVEDMLAVVEDDHDVARAHCVYER